MGRLMRSLERVSNDPVQQASILREIKNELDKGVSAPTVGETREQKLPPGWHKKFAEFGIEGDEGSIHISAIIPMRGLHRWQGVDLDTWKPVKVKPTPEEE
jgi:hypothetical protein